jgi:hypothetical protein
MAIYYNNAEGGTPGATVTTGNSGGNSGTAFNTVTLGTGALTYSIANPYNGQLSYALVPGSASNDYVAFTTNSTANCAARVYVYLTGQITAATQALRFGQTSVGTQVLMMGLSSTGSNNVMLIQGNSSTSYTGTAFIPFNTWLRWEAACTVGTTTSNGIYTCTIYTGNTMNVVDTFSTTSGNLGTTNIGGVAFGKWSNTGNWPTSYFDDFIVNDGQNTLIGPRITGTQFNNYYSFKAEDNGNGVLSFGERIR